MTNLTPIEVGTISAVGSAVVPPIVSLLKTAKMSAQVKQLIALVVSAAVAVVGIVLAGASFETTPLVELVALVAAGSQVTYGAYFRGSVVETALTRVGAHHVKPAPAAVTPPAGA